MRPTYGYKQQGRDAYLDGAGPGACPHAASEIRTYEWLMGWRTAAANDPFGYDAGDYVGDTEDEVEYYDRLQAEGELAEYDLGIRLSIAQAMLPSIEAASMGFPVEHWPKQCYAVAKHLLDSGLLDSLVETFGRPRLCYGMYDGEIADDALWASERMARHGWIEFDTGLVVDPTRWCFEGSEPKLSCATTENYDLAARRFIEAVRGVMPPPDFDPAETTHQWELNDPALTDLAHSLLGDASHIVTSRQISRSQAHWLANRPVEAWGELAADFYRFMDHMKLGALVPIDNRNYASEVGAQLIF